MTYHEILRLLQLAGVKPLSESIYDGDEDTSTNGGDTPGDDVNDGSSGPAEPDQTETTPTDDPNQYASGDTSSPTTPSDG